MAVRSTVLLKITVADPARLLTGLQEKNIPVEKAISLDDLTVQLLVERKFCNAVTHFAERQGAAVCLEKKNGLYWHMEQVKKRPILILGLLVMLLLTMLLPTRLLFFAVEGNDQIPSRKIIALAEENGLEFGVIRRNIRSEKIKNALLKAIPELEWVGINTCGCVATISVRERQKETPTPQSGVSNIIAVRDGIVEDILVTAGSKLVQPGQSVKRGDVLISGYTDCGLSIRAERAKGEVFAQTTYEISLVLPASRTVISDKKGEDRNFFLIFGKNRINFSESSGILDTGCVKMYEEKYVTLPGGFVLPLGMAAEHSTPYTPAEIPDACEKNLSLAAERYLLSQMVAGQIISRQEQVWQEDGSWYLEGSYVCLEMIGTEQNEEIILP